MSSYLHLDFDAFYASIEQLDNPDLSGTPVIVGGIKGQRGVVAACSYEARAFGIHSAMPIMTALKLCPHGNYLPVRMERYSILSREIMKYISSLVPVMHQISIDEAFVDISGTKKLLGAPIEFAASIKQKVYEKYGLKISIGVASNPYIAKLASAASKPDGLLEINDHKIQSFIDSLPIKKLWGIGEKTIIKLNELNIHTAEDIRKTPKQNLKMILGDKSAEKLVKIASGLDPGIINEQPKSHSISSEHTFSTDIQDIDQLHSCLFDLCNSVYFRALSEGVQSSTVTVRVRYDNFETLSLQRTFPGQCISTWHLFEKAQTLINPLLNKKKVRLIGVGLGNLSNQAEQTELFKNKDIKRKDIENTISQLNQKYGTDALIRAHRLNKD